MATPAILALEDGTVFQGISIGALGLSAGEVVFNTAMTGYQEILSDPSYTSQIITFTYPHIGNVGCNANDNEAANVTAAGLVIRDLPLTHSNWRAEQSLPDYLVANQIVAIAEIDTRALTRKLRNTGALNGCVMAGDINQELAIEKAKNFPGLSGMDLAQQVTTPKITEWPHNYAKDYHVVAYDFGIKQNILHLLAERGCKLTVVPAKTPAEDVINLNPDGIFLSNGPGDPAACDYAIENIKTLLQHDAPIFGICLGHQLLALACGAKTIKMKFGHHGANHPVQDLVTKKVFISSQNHGFSVDINTLPDCLQATHKSLFDDSLQGIRHQQKSAFSFQGHPEASPGPHDIAYLFDQFINEIKCRQDAKTQ